MQEKRLGKYRDVMTNVMCVSGRACESLCAPSLRIALELANDITHRERVAQVAGSEAKTAYVNVRGRSAQPPQPG